MKPPKRTLTPRPYPYSPITMGDFLRKKRLDLHLTQKQVSDILETSVDNIRNWEANRRDISLQFLPKVNEFVGFFSCDTSLSLGLRLKQRRENFGLSIKKLSLILNVDVCTIASWERRDHQPSQKSLKIIEGFLKSYSPKRILPKHREQQLGTSFRHVSFPNYIEYDSNWIIGERITVWRTSAGLSQRKLAKLSGLSFQSICRWEKGLRIPNSNYQKIIMDSITTYLKDVI